MQCTRHLTLLNANAITGEGNGTPLQYSRLENPTDGGAWWAAVHGVAKSRTRLSDFTFTFHFHALEKEMAVHSSVLAWRIPGTGEPGGLPSMESHSRIRLKRLSSSSSSNAITALSAVVTVQLSLGRWIYQSILLLIQTWEVPLHCLEGKLLNIHTVVHENCLWKLCLSYIKYCSEYKLSEKVFRRKNSKSWKKMDWNLNIFDLSLRQTKTRINDTPFFIETLPISQMKYFTQCLVRKMVKHNDSIKTSLQFRVFWIVILCFQINNEAEIASTLI